MGAGESLDHGRLKGSFCTNSVFFAAGNRLENFKADSGGKVG